MGICRAVAIIAILWSSSPEAQSIPAMPAGGAFSREAPARIAVAPAAISAQIIFGQSTSIDFGSGRPPELTWSTGLRANPSGLEMPLIDGAGDYRPFWWQSPPIPTGPSWRPPRSMSLTVALSGLDVVSNSTGVGYVQTFVRYSADRVHWSSWYAMKAAEGTTGLAPARFDLWLALPDVAREEYERLMGEWWRTDPVWASDKHEFCLWLASHQREYFAREVPFIGYMQVRSEGGARGLRVRGMVVDQSSSSGGLSSIPRGARRIGADGPWTFDLSKVGSGDLPRRD